MITDGLVFVKYCPVRRRINFSVTVTAQQVPVSPPEDAVIFRHMLGHNGTKCCAESSKLETNSLAKQCEYLNTSFSLTP